MKKIYLFILFLIAGNCIAQTSINGGKVSGTWTLSGSPYLIQGSIMVDNGSTLTIEPGVKVSFEGTYKLLVLGRLLAVGTATDSITFISSDTSIRWLGIRFENTPNSNDTSKLFYCKLQYSTAQTIVSEYHGGGAISFVSYSKAVISNCLISNNYITNSWGASGGGIFCYNSSPLIINNKISNNYAEAGGGINCMYNSSPLIYNNTISNNSAEAGGGILFSGAGQGGGTPKISRNIISNNNTKNYGRGGGIYIDNCNAEITHNKITNNYSDKWGGGLYCMRSGSVLISNNLISNNASIEGGAIICSENFTATIMNNTIANNAADTGGAIFCVDNSNPTLLNNIIWGNYGNSGPQICLYDEKSDPDFGYCNVDGGESSFFLNNNLFLGTYHSNIDSDPLFVNPSSGAGLQYDGLAADWSLQSNSPCINSGDSSIVSPYTDIANHPRVNDGRIDIGAYEFQIATTDIKNNLGTSAIDIFPNPSTGQFTISAISKKINRIAIYNSLGDIVYAKNNLSQSRFLVHLDGYSKGIYFLKIYGGTEVYDKKIIVE